MNFKRKGQSATEYLMTYGWAILAITIVGALLYTQVFSNKNCATSIGNDWQLVASMVPMEGQFKIDTDGNLSIVMENRLSENITVVEVKGTVVNTSALTISPAGEIAPGKKATITAPGIISNPGEENTCYTETISITYDVDNGLPGLKAGGAINGKYV